jgi:hypothetical protein
MTFARAIAVGAMFLLAGCGYHFTSGGRQFTADVHTIGVRTFANETREIGV